MIRHPGFEAEYWTEDADGDPVIVSGVVTAMPAVAARLADPRDSSIEATAETVYLLWSLKHGAWWASNDCGYTSHVRHAARYRAQDAAWRVTRAALAGDWRKGTVMVAAPEMWGLTDYPNDEGGST